MIERFKNQYKIFSESVVRRENLILTDHFNRLKIIQSIRFDYLKAGINNYMANGLDSSFRNELSIGGMLYDISNENLVSKEEYWWSIDDLSLIYLSDNRELYNELNKRKRYQLGIEKGGWFGMQYALLQIGASDWEGLKETIEYLKKVNPPYDNLFHDIDVYFAIYKGFIEKDKDLIQNGLASLEQPKFRKVRQRQITLEKHISIITLALAKLSWMHGIEVNIDSELVAKELLPFSPLKEYTIPYKFLRDYYREREVDWRYEPICPELQDWENDPENPNRKNGGLFKKLFG